MPNPENGDRNGHTYKSQPHRRAPAGKGQPAAQTAPPASSLAPPGDLTQGPPIQARPASPAGGGNKRGARKPGGVTLFGKSFDKKQFALLIAACVLAVLLVVCIIAALLSSPFAPSSSSAASASGSSLAPSSSVPYDQSAAQIDETLFETTVLAPTEDAGEEYVEETLFIGDSNTLRMSEYGNVTGVSLQNCIGIEGMGIQSATYNNNVRFSGYNSYVTIPQAVKLFQPRRIVVTFGTNNVGYNSTKNFIESYEEFLAALNEAYPYADIIIGAVPPIAYGCSYGVVNMGGIDEYNAALAKMADRLGYKFLNWSEALKDSSTGYAKSGYTVADGIHLNESAMKAMFDYFRTHSHIVEDTRPKPLEPIPTQLPIPRPVSSSTGGGASSSSSSASGQVSVPGVVGLSRGDVVATLANAGLTASFTEMNDIATAGLSIAQSPAPGAMAPAGSTVLVTLSLGPASSSSNTTPQPTMVTVPSVIGMDGNTAVATMAAAGLSAGLNGDPAGVVIAQDPAAGTQVPAGSGATVTTQAPTPPPPDPSTTPTPEPPPPESSTVPPPADAAPAAAEALSTPAG